MVAKAIINKIIGSKVQPPKFPEGTKKFTEDQANSLLKEGHTHL